MYLVIWHSISLSHSRSLFLSRSLSLLFARRWAESISTTNHQRKMLLAIQITSNYETHTTIEYKKWNTEKERDRRKKNAIFRAIWEMSVNAKTVPTILLYQWHMLQIVEEHWERERERESIQKVIRTTIKQTKRKKNKRKDRQNEWQ